MATGIIRDWYEQNLYLLSNYYQVSYDDIQFTWILIDSIELPDVYLDGYSPLLILTPGENIQNYRDYNFYINQNLMRIDGRKLPFIHENNIYNHLYEKGFARLSFHLKSFEPQMPAYEGDNMLTLVKSVYHFLGSEEVD